MDTIISLAYINLPVYPRIIEPQQVNLSNPEANSEPCQISKMELFAKIVNGQKPLTFFVKHFILDVWLDSEYGSVICYSFFGKFEDANKIDSVATQIYLF